MIDANFFNEPFGSKIKMDGFTLVKWLDDVALYSKSSYAFDSSQLDKIFESLSEHIDKYSHLKVDISTTPLNISILNLVLPQVERFKIKSIKVSWENLKYLSFNGSIEYLKDLEIYAHNPTELEIDKLLSILNPTVYVNIRCYENGPINEKGFFSYSELIEDLQLNTIEKLKKLNIKYKPYHNFY